MCASNMELDTENQDAYIYNSKLFEYLVSDDLNQNYLNYIDMNGDNTKVYFSKELKGESNPNNKVNAFLKRIEDTILYVQ